MTYRIGINGFGRIGRMVVRRALTLPDVEVVAINDLAHIGDLAYLLKLEVTNGRPRLPRQPSYTLLAYVLLLACVLLTPRP